MTKNMFAIGMTNFALSLITASAFSAGPTDGIRPTPSANHHVTRGLDSRNADRGTITIDTDFESGCLDRAVKLGENWYHLCLRPDTWYGFYFRIRGCKNKDIIFHLTCGADNAPAGYEDGKGTWDRGNGVYHKPVVSYDGKTWRRIELVEKDSIPRTFRFRHTFTENEAFVSFDYPYTHTDCCRYLQKIGRHPWVAIENIGKTRNGIDQPCITITRNVKARNLVLILSREDASEATASFAVEGVIDHLLQDNRAEAKDILERYVFKIVPMVSIDGVIANAFHSAGYGYGGTRWHESPAPLELENVKNATKKWMKEGYSLRLAGKLHSWVTFQGRTGISTSNPALRDVLTSTKSKCWEPADERMGVRPKGYFERFLLDAYRFPDSFYVHAHGENPDELRMCGKGLCMAMMRYLTTD